MEEIFGIAAFRSRQHVMAFDRELMKAGVRTSIVNTPRAVAAGCGLSVRFELKDEATVAQRCRVLRPENLVGLYYVFRRDGGRVEVSPMGVANTEKG